MLEGIACLVQNGADANIADDRGQTPLRLALTLRDKDLVMLLLEHDAEVTSRVM